MSALAMRAAQGASVWPEGVPMTAEALSKYYAGVRGRIYSAPQSPRERACDLHKQDLYAAYGKDGSVPNVSSADIEDYVELLLARGGVDRFILARIARDTGVSPQEILGHSRSASVVNARHEAIWRIYKETGWTHARIGKIFARDASSVGYAIERIESLKTGRPFVRYNWRKHHGKKQGARL